MAEKFGKPTEFVDWQIVNSILLASSNDTASPITISFLDRYRNLCMFNVITVATKSKRYKSFIHTKSYTTIKCNIPLNKFAVTIYIKVSLQNKKKEINFTHSQNYLNLLFSS